MAIIIGKRTNLDAPIKVESLNGVTFTTETEAHQFVVRCEQKGQELTLAGTISAKFVRADGNTVQLVGSISDGAAVVTLAQDCYNVPGRFQLAIFNTVGNTKLCIYACIGTVQRAQSGNLIDGGGIIPDVEDLIADIQAAVQSIPPSYTTLLASIAGTYSASKTYAVGEYAWYNGSLYRCSTAISTAEAWTSGHWTAAVLGDDVSAIKSAIDSMSTATAEDEGKALKAKTVSNGKVTEWEFGGVGGISNDVKEALLACFEKVAWIDDSGQDYYDALEAALYPPADLASISAVFTQGQAVIYDTDSLETLKQYLVVTAHYDDQTTETVIGYTLSGTLTEGTSTITVAYYGKTTTFSVTVTAYIPSGYTQYDYVKNLYSQTDRDNNIINTGLSSTYCDPEYEHEITFEIDENTISGSATSAFYGSRPYSGSAGSKVGNSIWMNPTSSPNKIAVGYNGVDSSFTITCSYGDKHTVKLNSGKIYLDDVMVKEQSGERESYDTSSIHLFGIGQGSGISGTATTLVKIYHFKLKDISTGNVISEMVACTDSNGKPGFYDVIRRSFHTMTDGTKYTCGNDE